MNKKSLRKFRLPTWLIVAGSLMLLSSCATVVQVQQSQVLPRNARWVLLPMQNYSETPQAGGRAEAIVKTLLAQRELALTVYPPQTDTGGLPVLDEQKRLQDAEAWAKTHDFRYAITGSVEEWHYKSGLDGEPAVGVSLRVIDLRSGKAIWSASGAKTGWGYQSASGTAIKLIRGLLDGLDLS